MKKNLLVIISLILATLFVFGACVKLPGGGNTSDDGTTDAGATDTQSPDTGTTDTTESIEEPALLLNNVNIAKYTLIYNGAAVKGSTYARDYFNSTLKELCGVELEKSKTAVDGYNIFIGVLGEDSVVNAFFDTCDDGMLGYDGKNVYLLAQDNSQLYDVVDAFFAKASNGAVNVMQNEKIAVAGDSIKVMSYNVLFEKFYDDEATLPRDITGLAEFIASEAPDVFGVQEGQSFHKDEILKAMPNYGCYEGDQLGGDKMQNMIFWNADKFTLVSKGFRYLTSTPLVKSKIEESNSYRGYSFVVLESTETHNQFMFVNTHLTYKSASGSTTDDTPRYKQAQYLKKFLEGDKYAALPIILVGDFNSVSGSNTITLVEGINRLDRAAKIAEKKGDTAGTLVYTDCTERNTKKVYDYIFVTSDRITTNYYTAIDKQSINPDDGRYLSDHLPVVAEIVIY